MISIHQHLIAIFSRLKLLSLIFFYGLFFQDRIAIFRATSHEVWLLPHYSNKQHRGNTGEGQFHLNEKTIQYHLDNHLYRWLSYEELYELFLILGEH